MRRVGAEDERALEQHLVRDPRAAAVAGEVHRPVALGALVGEPEAQELRGPERDVRLDRPLAPGHQRELRPVVTHAARPAAPWLDFQARIPAEAVARASLRPGGAGLVEDLDLPDSVRSRSSTRPAPPGRRDARATASAGMRAWKSSHGAAGRAACVTTGRSSR